MKTYFIFKRKKAEGLIRNYFNGWVLQDFEKIKQCIHCDAEVSECYGPVYFGMEQIHKWFFQWHKNGGKIIRWDIADIYYDQKKSCASVTWYFECHYDQKTHSFYGCSILNFKDEKIIKIKEYKMEKEKYYPFAD